LSFCCSQSIYQLNTDSPYPIGTMDATPDVINTTECPNGSLVHLDIVLRNGARYPTSGDIKNFNNLQKILSTNGSAITNSSYT